MSQSEPLHTSPGQQHGLRPGCLGVVVCGVIGVVIGSAFGMRLEYARGEREWSEIVQWGALSFGLPLGLVLGATFYGVVAFVWFILSTRPATRDKP